MGYPGNNGVAYRNNVHIYSIGVGQDTHQQHMTSVKTSAHIAFYVTATHWWQIDARHLNVTLVNISRSEYVTHSGLLCAESVESMGLGCIYIFH